MGAPTKVSLIDRVDERDRPVGTVRRGEALTVGANFRTAHVFLFDCLGQLLLQRLAPTRDRHPSRWGSSVAGYLYAGETYEHAAERRLGEELGLSGQLQSAGKIQMRDERSLKFVALFSYRNGDAEIREPDHISELRFWDLDTLDRVAQEDPACFTPTFLELFAHLRGRPAAR